MMYLLSARVCQKDFYRYKKAGEIKEMIPGVNVNHTVYAGIFSCS